MINILNPCWPVFLLQSFEQHPLHLPPLTLSTFRPSSIVLILHSCNLKYNQKNYKSYLFTETKCWTLGWEYANILLLLMEGDFQEWGRHRMNPMKTKITEAYNVFLWSDISSQKLRWYSLHCKSHKYTL